MKDKVLCGWVVVSAAVAGMGAGTMEALPAIARNHEAGLAQGFGRLMPGPARYVQDKGVFPLPESASTGFPQSFLDGLAPAERYGFAIWPMSAIVDDDTGPSRPLDPLLLPSKVESKWTFVTLGRIDTKR